MNTYSTPLALARELIRRPSYVSATQNEVPVQEYIEAYARANLPQMTIERQYLPGSPRYNLILRGKKAPKLLVLGHVDTVQSKDGWLTDPLDPVVRDDHLYGLGAADMKSSLAAFLWALAQPEQIKCRDTVMILAYVDEEYDFEGMLRFVEDDLSDIEPQMTLSLDGSLEVSTGCRGVIELKFTVAGQSGHASNPANGVNVITRSIDALQAVDMQLAAYEDKILGRATTNLASLMGGTLLSGDGEFVWSKEGNVIPDRAEIVYEVRTPVTRLDASLVYRCIESELAARDLTLVKREVRHDIAPWPADNNQECIEWLATVYQKAGVPFARADETLRGYIDAQMVADRIKVPTCIIGTGGSNKHGANENVSLHDINQAAQVYRVLLQEITNKELKLA